MIGCSQKNRKNYSKNAFDQKKKKPELKFNLGSALIGLRITGPCTLTNERNESYNPLPYDPL